MLLLVLIFVLAAFGLLLVALVTGTALWAWVSVAVSVAAAGALVYDWAQRRAAVRSGGGADRALGGPVPPSMPANVPEPPTTALPVMGGAMESATEVFSPMRPNSPGGPPVADAPETVAFRPVTSPPGSSERPSGAEPDGGKAGEQWSPRVTAGVSDRSNSPSSPAAAAPGDRPGEKSGDADRKGDEQARRTPPARDDAERRKAEQPATGDQPAKAESGSDSASDSERTTALSGSAAAAGKQASKPADSARQPETPDADNARTTAIPIKARQSDSKRPEGDTEAATAAAAAPAQASADAPAEAPASSASEVAPAEAKTAEAQAEASEAGANSADSASADSASADSASVAEASEADEPGEESADPAAAALVAGLEDEVLVVDEHPRYHVSGCQTLAGSETIPLPAREAVEYGFTPCGVCTPVRKLAERNRAASSS